MSLRLLIAVAVETQRRKRFTICHILLSCSQLNSYTDISAGGWSRNTTMFSAGSSKLSVANTRKEQKAQDIPILPQGCFKDKEKEMRRMGKCPRNQKISQGQPTWYKSVCTIPEGRIETSRSGVICPSRNIFPSSAKCHNALCQ